MGTDRSRTRRRRRRPSALLLVAALLVGTPLTGCRTVATGPVATAGCDRCGDVNAVGDDCPTCHALAGSVRPSVRVVEPLALDGNGPSEAWTASVPAVAPPAIRPRRPQDRQAPMVALRPPSRIVSIPTTSPTPPGNVREPSGTRVSTPEVGAILDDRYASSRRRLLETPVSPPATGPESPAATPIPSAGPERPPAVEIASAEQQDMTFGRPEIDPARRSSATLRPPGVTAGGEPRTTVSRQGTDAGTVSAPSIADRQAAPVSTDDLRPHDPRPRDLRSRDPQPSDDRERTAPVRPAQRRTGSASGDGPSGDTRRDDRGPEPRPVTLWPGDRLEVIYSQGWDEDADYRLQPGDRIRVEYMHLKRVLTESEAQAPQWDRQVRLQPDGKVSLPLLGQVAAAGLGIGEFARRLDEAYRDYYVRPEMLVTLVDTGSSLQDLRRAEQAAGGRPVAIDPDGKLRLPRVGPVPASGLKLDELIVEMNERLGVAAPGTRATVRYLGPPRQGL